MSAGIHDVCVVGRGLAGVVCAIAFARAGFSVVLAGPSAAHVDDRTTALLAGSVEYLRQLGVWEACRPHAAPLETLRIVDDLGRLVRAPTLSFRADELGLEALGYNLSNALLLKALIQHLNALGTVKLVEEPVTALDYGADQIEVTAGHSLPVRLVVGADGRQSLCRTLADIDAAFRPTGQVALTCTLSHSLPHHNTSTEFHTPSGPFTLVPLPGQHSGLVWVVDPHRAETLRSLPRTELEALVFARSHGCLGQITVETTPGLWPLGFQTARRLTAERMALVGEAAHVFPPIGAQGLNLGLKDIQQLVDLAQHHRADCGEKGVLTTYEKARRTQVHLRTYGVGLMNRSLLSSLLPASLLRGAGLLALKNLPPLRHALMRRAAFLSG